MRYLILISILIFSQTNLLAQDFNILDFGAKSDSKDLNTKAIQSAIDAAAKNGKGRVIIPAGTFLTGSVFLKSGVELHLKKSAVLLGTTDPNHYQKVGYWKSLILANRQHNIAITGGGEINGQGRELALNLESQFYNGQLDSADYNFVEMRPKYYLRPTLIQFEGCKEIKIKNIKLRNAAAWVQNYEQCENLTIDSIQVESDAYWNNDGIDIVDCKNVRLTNSFFNAADDGICLKSHSDQHLCDSIYIANCTVRSSASAVKFGTKTKGGFKNVIVRGINIYDTFRSAIALESVESGCLENVLVEDIVATNTGNAIFIRLGHRLKKDKVAVLKNVILRNIKVEVAFERPDYKYEIRGPALPFFHNTFPSSITGIPGHPVENVRLENIEIIYPGKGNNGLANAPLSRLDNVPEKIRDYPEFSMFGELPAWGFYVRHMDGLKMKNIQLKIKAPDYRPAFVFDDVKNLEIEDLKIEGDTKQDHIILNRTNAVKIDYPTKILKR